MFLSTDGKVVGGQNKLSFTGDTVNVASIGTFTQKAVLSQCEENAAVPDF